jgi:glutamine synthetase
MPQNDATLFFFDSYLKENPTIKFIRYQWIDYAGILRIRILPVSHCRHLLEHDSVLQMSPIAITSSTIVEFMPDVVPTGSDILIPDFRSLRACFYAPGHASVMCYVSEDHEAFGRDRCPRTLLDRSMLAAGRGIKCGFEVEFICLNSDGTTLNDCLDGFSTAAGLRNPCFPILEGIVLGLEAAGISVLQFHTEDNQGMFEISTGPLSPLEAVDAWVYTREAVKTMFAKHSIIATMHPFPVRTHPGIGTHIHISIDGDELTRDTFLAGIMHRLPALCAFSLPTEDSYERVNGEESEAGLYVAWGTQNRDVPVRKITAGHWEVRCCDGTANMYLVLAAYIASGLHGVEAGMALLLKNCSGNPAHKVQEERHRLGIQDQLPRTLQESLEALKHCNWEKNDLQNAATRYWQIKTRELYDLSRFDQQERLRRMIRHF